ncbi:MAG: bifunctional isocitrate dehydrogenase kinase/phosphatase [Gammaproteobacteria bacterium]|nr:bifunctional isocitrate dehydrogenase kinase/phosphatase [Gammaproteobacteria bacterium]
MSSDKPGNVEHVAAVRVFDAFRIYNRRFREITRRAIRHFETRNWASSRLDAVQRIELYERSVSAVIQDLREILGKRIDERDAWVSIKNFYCEFIRDEPDVAFFKTFFSSITRRLFNTLGVDPDVEFLALDVQPELDNAKPLKTVIYRNRGTLRYVIDEILADLPFKQRFRDLDSTIRFITAEIEAYRTAMGDERPVEEIELVPQLFYRGKRAYLVGRMLGKEWQLPLVMPFESSDDGLVTDAVILADGDVSMLFGFTRSYFHVDLPIVESVVSFLHELMPAKPVAELYTVLGRAKQGKTERYRALMHHLDSSTDLFDFAPGTAGMVMQVFSLPSFNVVFKVIRDRFAPPKSIHRDEVKKKYTLVFNHDRAGRLVDAQEFRRLSFDVNRFTPEVLESLLNDCSENCHVEDGQLIVEHLYIERRLTPLNLYLRQADAHAAREAIVDYGQAIRDLASSNIFTGDLLPKNFGVTRHGRVIFYDYDEVCFVTDCQFRDIPETDDYYDEMRADAWFYVGPNDVFPAQFLDCLGLSKEQRDTFSHFHGELLTASWWRRISDRINAGEWIDVLPYTSRSWVTRLGGSGRYAPIPASQEPAEA